MATRLPLDRRAKWLSASLQKSRKIVEGKPTYEILSFFTSDNRDETGDIIEKQATQRAIQKYRQWGNIRMMHQPIPVGKVMAIGEEDGLEWNQVKIKVVDQRAQELVDEEVLSALSVGIIVNDARPVDDSVDMNDPFWFFFCDGIKITDYDLVEISLVDHPANYDARITDKPGLHTMEQQRMYLFKAAGFELSKDKGSSEVQTLILLKEVFHSQEDATKWVSEHGFKHDKIDETENSFRFRQFSPDECDPDTYGTKEMTDGVKAVYCVKKGLTPTKDVTGAPGEVLPQDNMTHIEELPADEEKSHSELPDAAFAAIESGGEKDDSGKTTPRNLRHLPHHTSEVKDGASNDHIDKPLLRNALARVGQVKPVTDSISKEALVSKCEAHLNKHKSALDDGKQAEPEVEKTVDEVKPTPVEEKTGVVTEPEFVPPEVKVEVVVEKAVEPEVKKESTDQPEATMPMNPSDMGAMHDKLDTMHKKLDEVRAMCVEMKNAMVTGKEDNDEDDQPRMSDKPNGAGPKSAEPEVVKAVEPAPKVEETKGADDMVAKFKAMLDESLKVQKSEIVTENQEWTKKFIQDLMQTPAKGKSQMLRPEDTEVVPEESDEETLKKMGPVERQKEMARRIQERLKSNH